MNKDSILKIPDLDKKTQNDPCHDSYILKKCICNYLKDTLDVYCYWIHKISTRKKPSRKYTVFSTTKENILKILILVTLSSEYFEKSFLVIR